MSLAVALGAKSVSSRPVPTFFGDRDVLDQQTDNLKASQKPLTRVRTEEEDDDTKAKREGHVDTNEQESLKRLHMTTALSDDQEWQAIVTVTYYDMLRDEIQPSKRTVAAVRVQILPSFEPLSSRYPDTLHRIKLPTPSVDLRATPPCIQMKAVFSSDRRNLSVLLPYPELHESAVVIFQLRRPRPDNGASISRPALPSYIHLPATPTEPPNVPVATNPRVVQHKDEGSTHVSFVVSDLEDAAITPSGPSILLAGCTNGSILAISYRPLVVAGSFFHDRRGDDDEQSENNPSKSIRQLSNMTDHDMSPNSDETTGRLVVLRRDGSATICRTLMVQLRHATTGSPVTSKSSELDPLLQDESETSHASFTLSNVNSSLYLSIKPIETITGSFLCAEWISTSYLALLKQSDPHPSVGNANSSIRVQVWGICADGPSEALSSWEMTASRLHENGHSTYRLENDRVPHNIQFVCNEVALQYDSFSDCLAISAVLIERPTTRIGRTPTHHRRPFVCVWNWRRNLEGFLVTQEQSTVIEVPSVLSFVKSSSHARRLAHTLAVVESRGPRIRKELYDMAILSHRSTVRPTSRLQRANNLLLGSKTISYPIAVQVSAFDDFEVEWQDSNVPHDYVMVHGAPCLAATGHRLGRSVAIASSHGLCVLDCGRGNTHPNDRGLQYSFRSDKNLASSRSKPRWYRFGNEAEERSFQVLACAWWEGASGPEDKDGASDDILVALIHVRDTWTNGYYLSCWAQKMLDFDHQLLVSDDDAGLKAGNLIDDTTPRYGVLLPPDFNPAFLDILEQPMPKDGSSTFFHRRCVLLVSDQSQQSNFVVYQIQIAKWLPRQAKSYRDMLPFIVQSKLASLSSAGSASTLFLASAAFTFDLDYGKSNANESDYAATLGVVRGPGGGVDALAVGASGVITVGEVIGPNLSRSHSEVSSYWLADFILNKPMGGCGISCFSWSLEMANGSLYCWSLPCITEKQQAHDMLLPFTNCDGISHAEASKLVQSVCTILGTTTPVEKAASWMQQPEQGPRKVVSLARVPRSLFGCELGAEQTCKKMHRALGEAFEQDLFRSDFLEHEIWTVGDCVLTIPTFVPTLYALLVEVKPPSPVETSDNYIVGHILERVRNSLYAESSLMSLQLLVLRSVELIHSKVQRKEMLISLVRALIQALTPLQLTALFLDVGRQIEPSALSSLFPLPSVEADWWTVRDMFHLALASSSIGVAIAALPLFEDHRVLQTSCSTVLSQCLKSIVEGMEDRCCSYFDFVLEERSNLRDVFRYALKLDDSAENNSSGESIQSGSSHSHDSVNESYGYSLTCGMSRFFRTSRKVDYQITSEASSFISKGFQVPMVENGSNGDFPRGDLSYGREAEEVTQILLEVLFLVSDPTSNPMAWKKAATLAYVLLGDGSNGLPSCTSDGFENHLQESTALQFDLLRRDTIELMEFIGHCLRTSDAALSDTRSSVLLDLSLILLGRLRPGGGVTVEAPALILVALITGHLCGRTNEFVSLSPDDHPVLAAFYEAAFLSDPSDAE